MAKRVITTKDVGLIRQLYSEGQIALIPEFQRNAVWPKAAKAYLIDTILNDRPMPLFFFQRTRSSQSGKPVFQVVDGQQRLRAILEFIDDRFGLTESSQREFKGKRFSQLSPENRSKILDYDLTVEELSGYDLEDVKDIFVRMNRFVVKLSPQELRHAREQGAFYEFVERLGASPVWDEIGVFSSAQKNRMKAVEFGAELAILLIEGPQDKKGSVDLYYQEFRSSFPEAKEIERRLSTYLNWIKTALPDIKKSRFRRPTDLYSLVGALDLVSRSGQGLGAINIDRAGDRLRTFEMQLTKHPDKRLVANYLIAASRQTDNLAPRELRIGTLASVIAG